MSTRAAELVRELSEYLGERFRIAMCVRVIGVNKGYRLFQTQETASRHLVDVRPVKSLPNSQTVEDIHVLTPPELIASKVSSYHSRQGQPKGFSDMRDLAMLFLTFPELKTESGAVSAALKTLGATAEEMNTWRELVAQEIRPSNDDDKFD